MARGSGCVFLAVWAVGLAGCGGGGDGVIRKPVSGTITWEGAPLPDGTITFDAEDPKVGRSEGGAIKDGAYQLEVVPAQYRVRITANREGKFDKVVNMKTYEQYIPAKYNTKTTLTADATKGTKFDFGLKK